MTDCKKKFPTLTSEAQQALEVWLADNVEKIPSFVRDALTHYVLLLAALAGGQRQMKAIVLQLRRALGITASSEKRKNSGDPIGPTMKPGDSKPKDREERARLTLERLKNLASWHKGLARKHKLAIKEIERKQMKVEDIVLTDEELAQCDRENAEFSARLALGDGPDEAFESPKQAFMQGGDVGLDKKTIAAKVNEDLLADEEIVARMTDERIRYNFSLGVCKITVEVEKVIVKDEGSSTKIISASTRNIGPPGMAVTWDFLANMAIMVSQYAMPFTRLGSLLTVPGKRFTSAMLSRMFCYVAHHLLPIYLHLFRSIANTPLFSGDDTQTKVLEFARYQMVLKDNPQADPPWLPYATTEKAKEAFKMEAAPSLAILTAMELGFEFDRKDGNGQKKSLQTTVLWGRRNAEDPRSSVIFYRSHIGSFGNLLSISLDQRLPEFKKLIIQSDLAAVNLVTDAEVAARFDIEMAGCTSHARRPFALHEEDDPELCAHMLHLFKGLYIYEKGLDIVGRNESNVRAIRGADSFQMWEEIKELAEIIAEKWSKGTKLGSAARYILRHFKKLTAYLGNPIISISNDFSERMLRMENLIQANALFRNSLEGRFALDIIRTVLQTAIAARAPLLEYLVFVLRASPDKVKSNPEEYTPLAYVRRKNAAAPNRNLSIS